MHVHGWVMSVCARWPNNVSRHGPSLLHWVFMTMCYARARTRSTWSTLSTWRKSTFGPTLITRGGRDDNVNNRWAFLFTVPFITRPTDRPDSCGEVFECEKPPRTTPTTLLSEFRWLMRCAFRDGVWGQDCTYVKFIYNATSFIFYKLKQIKIKLCERSKLHASWWTKPIHWFNWIELFVP